MPAKSPGAKPPAGKPPSGKPPKGKPPNGKPPTGKPAKSEPPAREAPVPPVLPPPPPRPPRFISPHERAEHETIERCKAAARELVRIAETVHDVSEHITAQLAAVSPSSAVTQLPTEYARRLAFLRTLTHEEGLGFAFTGGRLGKAGSAFGDLLGRRSLATDVLVASLRLRLVALQLVHPEMTEDPRLARFIEAVHDHHEIEIMRSLRALFDDEGAVHAFSSLAPMFAEILSLKAMLDRNPFNDATAWGMATGTAAPTAEPFFGFSVGLMTRRDRGAGAARPIDPEPHESGGLARTGSVLGFVRNIALLGNDGRVVIQTVRGPDGVERHVVQVPGMRPAFKSHGSPASLVGAFRSSLEAASSYTGALRSAIAQYGVPDGAELALIGHSAGGPAAMNLAQDPEFCRRFEVTHVIALGAPVDQKHAADPDTFVATITNQHDIVPTLDGIDAGSCFDLHPDWYVVDYTEATHQFPDCHGVEHYLRDLEYLLVEPREYLDTRLAPYAGEVVRTQLYQTYVREPKPPGYPFLTVPTSRATVGDSAGDSAGSPTGDPAGVELPITCARGNGLIAFYPVDRHLTANVAKDGSRTEPLGLAGRALLTVFAAEHREGSLRAHRMLGLGVIVDSPWSGGRLPWVRLLRRADQQGVGIRLLGLAVSSEEAAAAYRELWGVPAVHAAIKLSIGVLGARVTAELEDGGRVGFGGLLGPGAPAALRDAVLFSRRDRRTLRSQIDFRGLANIHAGGGLRLLVAGSGAGLTEQVRELGLDRSRPPFCVTSRGFRARINAAAALPGE